MDANHPDFLFTGVPDGAYRLAFGRFPPIMWFPGARSFKASTEVVVAGHRLVTLGDSPVDATCSATSDACWPSSSSP